MKGMFSTLQVAILAFCACSPVVDTSDLGEISDYKTWPSFEIRGEIPAHNDTIRIIYANEQARSWSGAGAYPIGSIVIKEIYPKDQPDDIDYIAIMRKLETAPDNGELHNGWLFTILHGDITAEEENNLRCYRSCHLAAPYDSLFHDLGD